MNFSDFVKQARVQLGMSQKQLAEALNANYTTINRWENGHVEPSNIARKIFYDFCQDNFIEIPIELRNTQSLSDQQALYSNGRR